MLFLCLLLSAFSLCGQDSEKVVKITTNNGTILNGTVIYLDEKTITIKTLYGENNITRTDIESIEYIDVNEVVNEGDVDYYSGSHYLFGQSAFGLKKGQVYYENTYLFLNNFTFGVTDNFSIGGGFEIASILFGTQFPIMFITPKLSFPFSGGAFSVASSLGVVPSDGTSAAGLLSAALTLGTPRDNFTLGVATGYTFNDGLADGVIPISFSGIKRVSEKVSLITENVLVASNGDVEGVLSAGVRIHGRGANFLTLTLLRPTADTDGFLAFPFFSGTVKLK